MGGFESGAGATRPVFLTKGTISRGKPPALVHRCAIFGMTSVEKSCRERRPSSKERFPNIM